ncbi:MAG: hypothetical protein NZ522_07725 [Chitinophagales bacterium]|nr:hypothetical protein [Chitinophagales bacterium]
MAKASLLLYRALLQAADNLRQNQPYEWGHMGSCNCGHLAQVLLNVSKDEIHSAAMEKCGDWNEQIASWCPVSGLEIDRLIFMLFEKGLSREDLMHLEYLSSPDILSHIPEHLKPLRHNNRNDVILYLETWAGLMANELTQFLSLNQLLEAEEIVSH